MVTINPKVLEDLDAVLDRLFALEWAAHRAGLITVEMRANHLHNVLQREAGHRQEVA